MDVFERRVLRRKRPLVADLVGFSYSDQKKYKELGLLTDQMIPDIMIETTEFGQMCKFIDGISNRKGCLEKFYSVLEEHGLSWIVGEIKVEILTEVGQLDVEEYVYREAGMLVHRQFGEGTRMSEVEKKELQLLLALRYQAGKQSWHQHINEVKGQCQAVQDWKREECRRLKQLVDKVKTFLRVQQTHINALVHDTQSPPEVLKEDSDQVDVDADHLGLLEDVMDHLLAVLSRILFEKESMTDERKKCLEILQISKPATQLDTILHYALSNAQADTVNAKREAELSDKIVQSQDSRMKAIQIKHDRDLMDKERHIAHLDHMIRDKEAQLRVSETKVKDMTQKWEEVNEELKQWKTRSELLEKTRRLGYYTPGWYDRLYNMNGIEYGRQSTESMDHPPPLVQRTGYSKLHQSTASQLTKPRSITSRPSSEMKKPLFQKRQITFVKVKRPLSSKECNGNRDRRLTRSLDTSLTHSSSTNC